MDYKYEVVNYDKIIPAVISRMELNSDIRKTELRWHREPELVYVIDGESECLRNGEAKIISKGEFILFNSEDVHLVRAASGGSCVLLSLNFSTEYMRQFCKSIDSMIFDLADQPKTCAEISRCLRKIAEVDDSGDDYSLLMQIAYVNRIYYLLLKNCLSFRRAAGPIAASRRDFSYAKTAIAYINENYRREIPLDEIAAVVNLSPSYFSKYFKSATKVSFSEYLANLRLENAIQDMLADNATVSTAAMENGFANVKSFITQCKKIHNCTPAQYKKRISGK